MTFKSFNVNPIESQVEKLSGKQPRQAAGIVVRLQLIEEAGIEQRALFAVLDDRHDVFAVEIGWRPKSILVVIADSKSESATAATLFESSRTFHRMDKETVARQAAAVINLPVRSVYIP